MPMPDFDNISKLEEAAPLDQRASLKRLSFTVASVAERFSEMEKEALTAASQKMCGLSEGIAWQRPLVALFLCAPLQTSADFLDYIAQIRFIARRFSESPDDLRLIDPPDQHCTIYVINRFQTVPEQGIVDEEASTLQNIPQPPFTLHFSRPLITSNGALILKGECFSDSFFSIRRSRNDAWEFETGSIHTSVAYLRRMSAHSISSLRASLQGVRTKEFSFRIRELRVGLSIGIEIVDWGKPIHLKSPTSRNADSVEAETLNSFVPLLAGDT
jgi:hypothetical protein